MKRALAAYLSEVERGLQAMPVRRRRLVLRELEAHLFDEAEALGITDEGAMSRLLDTKESPQELASELSDGDVKNLSHRHVTSLLAGALIGAFTGAHLFAQGWIWYISVAFGLAHGLAVGAGFFWVRRHWQRLGDGWRLVMAISFTALLSIPLGFTSTRGFVLSRTFYGAYTGFLLERHAQKRPIWQWALETLAFTAFVFFMEVIVMQRVHFHWNNRGFFMVLGELSFNLAIQLGVIAALRLQRMLAGRWVLRPQNL
ncbi:MAG: hypothetical protein IPP78_01700 [Holophagaceae bacterium]|nr:hypothetical protein [Holophagaceae bacterium]